MQLPEKEANIGAELQFPRFSGLLLGPRTLVYF